MVVINGNRITFVSRSAAVPLAKNTHVIDGRGQFLIPGLWDMHVHSAFGDWFPGGRDIILPLFIANGVTGVRDMGGDIPVLFAWRSEIADGKIIGPHMIISGPMLDALLPDGKLRFPSSIAVTTPQSAVAAVDSLKAQGVDFIKVQSVISHDAYLAAAAEAHKVDLPIVGHVPDKVRIAETIAAGQKSIEHLMGSFEGCSTKEDTFIAGQGDLKLLLTTQDKKRCDALILQLADSQVWQVPTLAWQRGGTFLDQRDLKHDPLDKYVPAYWRDVTWKRFTDEMMPGLVHDPLELRKEYFAAICKWWEPCIARAFRFWLEPTPHPASTSCPDSACTTNWPISSKPDSRPWNRCKLRPAACKILGIGKQLWVSTSRQDCGSCSTQRQPARRHSQYKEDHRSNRQRPIVRSRRA